MTERNSVFLTRHIGQTTYRVRVHLSETAEETMEDKILRLIRNDGLTKDRPAGRADDPFLVDKLLQEKDGIFLWCLEGLHRLIGNNYQFSISGKARENMETVKRSSNNVIEFLQSEGYIRFRADSEASSKAIYEAYTRWCDDNAQKPMSANRVSSELTQNERLYNVESTNNVHVGGKRVRGFMGIEVVNPLPY